MRAGIFILSSIMFLFINTFSYAQYNILKQSDRKIVPQNCSYKLTMKVIESDGNERVTVMQGYKRGEDKNMLIVEQPAGLKGIIHLRNGNTIWTYYPTIHRSIKTAYKSVFMNSTLSYGDVLSMAFSYDYNVISSDKSGDDMIKFVLKPKPGHKGYARIVILIKADSLLPVKREYYSLSGMLLKSCIFKDFKFNAQGEIEYIKEEFYEPLKSQKTIVVIEIINRKTIPVSRFNPGVLKFISGE